MAADFVKCNHCQKMQSEFLALKLKEQKLESQLQEIKLNFSRIMDRNQELEDENNELKRALRKKSKPFTIPETTTVSTSSLYFEKMDKLLSHQAKEIITINNQKGHLLSLCVTSLAIIDHQDELISKLPQFCKSLISHLEFNEPPLDEIRDDFKIFGFDISTFIHRMQYQKETEVKGLNSLLDLCKQLQEYGIDSTVAYDSIRFMKEQILQQREIIQEMEKQREKSKKLSKSIEKIRNAICDDNLDDEEHIFLSIMQQIKRLKNQQQTNTEAAKTLQQLNDIIDDVQPTFAELPANMDKLAEILEGRRKLRELANLLSVQPNSASDDEIYKSVSNEILSLQSTVNELKTEKDQVLNALNSNYSNESDKPIIQQIHNFKKQSLDLEGKIIEISREFPQIQAKEIIIIVAQIINEIKMLKQEAEKYKDLQKDMNLVGSFLGVNSLESILSEIKKIRAENEANQQLNLKLEKIQKSMKNHDNNIENLVKNIHDLEKENTIGLIAQKRLKQVILHIVSHIQNSSNSNLVKLSHKLLDWCHSNDYMTEITSTVGEVFDELSSNQEYLFDQRVQLPGLNEFIMKHTPALGNKVKTWPEYCLYILHMASNKEIPIPSDFMIYYIYQLRTQKSILLSAISNNQYLSLISSSDSFEKNRWRSLIYVAIFCRKRNMRFPNAAAAIERLRNQRFLIAFK